MAAARSRKRSEAKWRDLLESGPTWRGGYGMAQEDANCEFMEELAQAATGLAPLLPSTEQVALGLVQDLIAVAQLPVDDSFGTLADGVNEVAEAFTPVFAGCRGPLLELAAAVAEAATMPGAEYFVFAPSGDWKDTPFGMWVSALGGDFAAAVTSRIDPNRWCDPDFEAGLAACVTERVTA